MSGAEQGLKIYPDAIAYCTSGVMDPGRKRILSYLHKALKPVNQLKNDGRFTSHIQNITCPRA